MQMAQIPEIRKPCLLEDWVYRYYFTDEFPFGRRPSRYVRERRLSEIAQWLFPLRPRRVLEAGCGPAELTALFHRLWAKDCQIVSLDLGIDFVPLATAMVQANGGVLKFVLGNAIQLPFQTGSFDLVASMEMIEHVPRWPLFFSEAARVLTRNGLLIISTPTRAGLHSWLKRGWQAVTGRTLTQQGSAQVEGTSYELLLAKREILAAATRYGFVLEESKVKIFMFSFLPPALFYANLLAERVLENIPGLNLLGVTRFYRFRKRE
jgi:SAM-dependent methyltransferase